MDINDAIKITVKPLDYNKLLINVFNMHDSFDNKGPINVDILQVAKSLYAIANNGKSPSSDPKLTHVTLTTTRTLGNVITQVTVKNQEMYSFIVEYPDVVTESLISY